jgi:hypothetical protein
MPALLDDFDGDHRIAGRANRAMIDGVRQLGFRRGVIPQARARRLRHLV